MADNPTEAQIGAALAVVDEVLGPDVVAVYLYGSAVEGGLRPGSDLDLLVVAQRPTTSQQRRRLATQLRPISRRGVRPEHWRPIELTVVAKGDVKPLRVPLRTDFQYGEWLRDDLDAGRVEPAEPHNPDLPIVLAQVSRSGLALRGPAAGQVIDDVPVADLRLAMHDAVNALVSDLGSDTTNVLLTLARMWRTLTIGDFVPKDVAAAWAAARLDSVAADALDHAAAVYRGEAPEDWSTRDAQTAAAILTQQVARG